LNLGRCLNIDFHFHKSKKSGGFYYSSQLAMPLSPEFLKYLEEANISQQEYNAASIADRATTFNLFRSSLQEITPGS
jgi:hypothetical protein